MAINAIGQDVATYGDYSTQEIVKDKSSLKNDDFMTLLLVELQNQDPTKPTDTEAILTQTSELATLESTDKTNKTLADLSTALASSEQFSSISAIGKTADLGSSTISHDEGSSSSFEVYFPQDIKNGTLNITDMQDNLVATIDVESNPSGVYQFDWDGKDQSGNIVDGGLYKVNADYSNPDGESLNTKLGSYPIESIKFDGGSTLVKLGSNYVPIDSIKEIY